MMPEEACLRGDLGLVKRLIAANASAASSASTTLGGVATDFSWGNAMMAEIEEEACCFCMYD